MCVHSMCAWYVHVVWWACVQCVWGCGVCVCSMGVRCGGCAYSVCWGCAMRRECIQRVHLHRRTFGRSPSQAAEPACVKGSEGEEGRRPLHRTLFNVLWIFLTASCTDVLISASRFSFHARPWERKWCDFSSNSNTRELFLRSLFWGQCLVLQSLLQRQRHSP